MGVAGDGRGRSAQQPRGAVKKPFSDLPSIKSHPWTFFTKQAFPDNEEVEAEMAWAALVCKSFCLRPLRTQWSGLWGVGSCCELG